METDIRWQQRFSNYSKAFRKLEEAINYIHQSEDDPEDDDTWELMDEMRKESLIKRFEFTYELAWNVMKDYAFYQGIPDINSPKEAIREAFRSELIADGHIWMDMIKSRNLTSHTYNESTANEIYYDIINRYYDAFLELKNTMEEKQSGEQHSLF